MIVFIFSLGYTLLSFGLDFGTLSSPEGQKDDHPFRVVWYLVVFVIYVLIFKPVGYVISTMLFTATLFLIMNNKWYISIIAGLATGIVFYFLFTMLSIPLPQGILGNL